MALTATNLNTLQLLNIVNRTSTNQSKLLTQLSTGSKINSAADNPAGLIAMENFDAQITAINASLDNNQRADSMLSTADSALEEVSSLLSDIETLALASVNDSSLSQAEIDANQAQIDAALNSIDRISNTTTFNGKKLLDGSRAIGASQTGTNTVTNLKVYTRNESTSNTAIAMTLQTAATAGSGAVATTANTNRVSSDTTIVVTGNLGSETVQIASRTTRDDIILAINAAKASTGVSASLSGQQMIVRSTSKGSDEFVKIDVLSGGNLETVAGVAMGITLGVTKDYGTDAVATIGGRTVTADGEDFSYSANGISLSFSSGAFDTAADTQTITVQASTGMTFQLGEESNTRSTIGIDQVHTTTLGNSTGTLLHDIRSGGSADLASKSANTLTAIRSAITQVAASRGRIGGFQKFQVQTSVNSLTNSLEAITAARSTIADTDYAVASAELNRQSVLLNSGISLLGLANQQASQLLSLLG